MGDHSQIIVLDLEMNPGPVPHLPSRNPGLGTRTCDF